ncbi:MAG: hypothetical protein JW847_06945 [Candidatus Omnitrophica bacterium]|nr:hypothetical protein [Candidatus Omnitrophota bacterium]
MKKMIISIAVVGLLMGLMVSHVPSAVAQEEVVAQMTTITGTLVAINAEESTITVEQVSGVEGEEPTQVVLKVEASTMIKKAEAVLALGDLVVGETVAVNGMVNDAGETTAWEILVQ